MKNKNYKELVEKYFPDKDSFLKETLIQLLEDNILTFVKEKDRVALTKKCKSNLPKNHILPEDNYFSEKYENIREKFPTLEAFRLCFYKNLIETPYCCICGVEKVKIVNNSKFSQTCGCKECVDALRKQTCLEIYGSECSLQNENSQKKAIETNLKLYGVENASSSPIIRQRIIESNLKNYGVEYPQQLGEKKEKAKQTNIERYGVEYAMQNEEIKKKSIINNRIKHDGFHSTQLESNKRKRIITYKKNRKEGKHKNRKNSSAKYYFNNEKFDSSLELAFYIYHTEVLKEIVEREPISITYKVDDVEHEYYPDFRINNQLFEIKGSWGINWKGEWCLPSWAFKKLKEKYKNEPSFVFMQQVIKADKPFKAKYKVAKENNVIIYPDNSPEIIEVINYCRTKFGKRNWYQQFQIKSKKSKDNKA